MVKIRTPGHGIILDSLIMYGILGSIKSYDENILSDIVITFTGNEYVIDIEGLSRNVIVEAIINFARKYSSNIVRRLVDESGVIQKQSRAKLESTIKVLTNSKLVNEYIADLESPLHLLRFGEGRISGTSRRIRVETVWLAIMPTAGKFLIKDYKAVIKEYKICIVCKGLALIGLFIIGLMGASSLKSRRRKTHTKAKGGGSIEIIPIIDGVLEAKLIGYYIDAISYKYTDLYKKISNSIDTLPGYLIPKVVLIDLATAPQGPKLFDLMRESGSSWHMVSIKFDIGARRLMGFEEINIDPLILGITSIKPSIIARLNEIIDLAIRRLRAKKLGVKGIKIDVDTIDLIVKYLEYRDLDSLYKAIREIYKDEEARKLLSLDLARELTSII